MSFFDLLVYGALQGIAEFLPISSSAHLALLPYFLKIDDPGVIFDLMMHLGTALAIIVYFRQDLKLYLRNLKASLTNFQDQSTLVVFNRCIILGTFVTAVCILGFKPISESYGRNPQLIIFNLLFFGILMWLADRKKTNEIEKPLTLKSAFFIGIAQAVAIFPGVSRSGATLSCSRFLGLSRVEASRFSFLLSLPIIFLGALAKLPELFHGQHSFSLLDCAGGITVSFVFGLFTIHYFLKLIKKIGLFPFTIYRIILALLLFYYFKA